MKAIILAAGLGTRLLPITKKIPKALVSVNGKPIIVKQIENLFENNITDITIISGYKSDMLNNEIKNIYPEIKIIENKNYDKTNNMYSAYLARNYVCYNSFIMMNGDVFFDSSVIQALLVCPSPNAIVTDFGIFNEESMKVVKENERIIEISKEITVERAFGLSIDVYKFSADAGNTFFNKCSEYINGQKKVNYWSEVALNDILSLEVFHPCQVNGRWIEIDNFEDLADAERIFYEN